MAKTLLAVVFLSANLLHSPQGPARARRLVEALFVGGVLRRVRRILGRSHGSREAKHTGHHKHVPQQHV